MPAPDQSEVLRQLASIRRELRFTRWLLLFVSVALSVLLFAPAWAARLAEWTPVIISYVLPVAGGVALVVFAAAVTSRLAPPRPAPSAPVTKDPAV